MTEPKYFGGISFDYWPPRDWFRFNYYPYKNGKSLQICVGPIRFDFSKN
jgi:hypothetical protein